MKIKPQFLLFLMLSFSTKLFASDIIPTDKDNNLLYYQMGGGSDFALPASLSNSTINLGVEADLSVGNTCGAFNPMLSLTNTFNDLKNNMDNIEQGILNNATGSLAQMPMYFLAQANPTAYNMINNALISAHKAIAISTKSCEQTKAAIAQGKNPYHDWAAISVGDQWKQHLSLTASGQEDINDAKKDVDQNAGNHGVPWIQGSKTESGFSAGGLNQPPIRVVADTVRAGYNAILMRGLNDSSPAPQGGELSQQFPTPQDAMNWITNVVGDQTVTTCNDSSCKSNQAGISGRGLLPWITTCSEENKAYCADNIRINLSNLVTEQTPITKENLEAVSASGIMISPQVIQAIRNMDNTQQGIIVSKLSQEVATQKVVEKALLARNILQTGSQVPVIASNTPAQKMIHQSLDSLDKDIQSLSFEAQVRKQMMSDTVAQVLHYQSHQQSDAISMAKVNSAEPLMENSAITQTSK
jgi:integrating conjugative element protein (TIGR03755 family)